MARIAVRVSDWGGDGGLCSAPITLSDGAPAALSDVEYLRRTFAARPADPRPVWLDCASLAWTIAAHPEVGPTAVVGSDGSVSPYA